MGSASSDIDSYVYRVGYYNVSSKVSIKHILNKNSIHPIYACYPSYHYYITQPTMNYFKTFILHFPTYRLLKKGTDEGRLLSPVQSLQSLSIELWFFAVPHLSREITALENGHIDRQFLRKFREIMVPCFSCCCLKL